MREPADIARIEAEAVTAWPPATVVGDGQWRIGYTPDHPSKRLNSFCCLGGDDLNIDGRLEEAIAFYTRRGVRPLFRHLPLTPDAVERRLDASSWTRFDMCMVMTRARDATDAKTLPEGIAIGADGWLDLAAAAKGMTDGQKAAHGRAIGRIPGKVALMTARDVNGKGVAVAVAAVTGGLLGIIDVITVEGARRSGHGRRVIQASLWWGATVGASEAYLQVALDNAAAIPLYRSLGFADAFPYHYRGPPA